MYNDTSISCFHSAEEFLDVDNNSVPDPPDLGFVLAAISFKLRTSIETNLNCTNMKCIRTHLLELFSFGGGVP